MVHVELDRQAVTERDPVAPLLDPAAVGQRPERREPPLVDFDLLLDAGLVAARLDGQERLVPVAPEPHLDGVGDRQISLLDLAGGVRVETIRKLLDQELALGLDAVSHRRYRL